MLSFIMHSFQNYQQGDLKLKKPLRKITVYSFGHDFPEDYPQYPGKKIEQHIISLRSVLPDPYFSKLALKKSGLDPEVKNYLTKESEKVRHGLISLVSILVCGFVNNETKDELKIYFGCIGGWQRSVYMAELFKEWISIHYRNSNCAVSVEHLSMHRWENKEI